MPPAGLLADGGDGPPDPPARELEAGTPSRATRAAPSEGALARRLAHEAVCECAHCGLAGPLAAFVARHGEACGLYQCARGCGFAGGFGTVSRHEAACTSPLHARSPMLAATTPSPGTTGESDATDTELDSAEPGALCP